MRIFTSDMKSFRITVMGPETAGKTCIISQLTKKGYRTTYDPTIEQMYRYDITNSNNENIKLEILDTAGGNEFPVMRKLAIQKSNAILLVFDLQDAERSFKEVEKLKEQITAERNGKKIPIIVVGNKSDLVNEQQALTYLTLEAVVSIDWGYKYITTSAKNGENLPEVLECLCQQLNVDISRDRSNSRTTNDFMKNKTNNSSHRRSSFFMSIRRKLSLKDRF